MKELKTYAHLYLGCEVRVRKRDDWSKPFNVGRICEVTRRSNHGDWIKVWFDDVITVTNETLNELTSNAHHYFINQDEIKLILRPLSDMTEEEAKEIWNKCMPDGYGYNHKIRLLNSVHTVTNAAEIVREICVCGYDIFQLIDAGLAVSKTETKN